MAHNIPTNTTILIAAFSCLFIISSSVIFIDAAGKYGRPGIHPRSIEKVAHLHLDLQQHNGSSNSSMVCVMCANATSLWSPTTFSMVVDGHNAPMEGLSELPTSMSSLSLTHRQSSLLHRVASDGCLEYERIALLKFKAGLQDPDGRLSSWRGLDCCRWVGVGCDYTGGSVLMVNLSNGIHLSKNLSGVIDPSLLQLKSLRHLDLSGNSFYQIAIPNFIGSFKELRYLNLAYSGFTGTIPHQLFDCAYLEALILEGNNLSGGIPKSIGTLQYLRLLDLSANKLSGGIPTTLLDCSSLQFLNLGGNNLSGDIPTSSGLRLTSDLKVLNFSDNQLSGEFPSFTHNLSGLETLDLAFNKLHGVIPAWIENIQSLKILHLRSNRFSGQIPSQLSKLKLLQVLDLAKNNLTGPIPQQLGGLSSMMHEDSNFERHDKNHDYNHVSYKASESTTAKSYISYGALRPSGIGEDDYYYAQTITVDMKGLELVFVIKTIFLLTSIDLSDNQLSGRFPEELLNLTGLIVLGLSRNFLSGTIPERIGKMHALESLDLSNNQFTGRIPISMTSMTFLCFLNLSYNHLSGEIPIGGQLDTFKDASFLGNSDLCGYFLQRRCLRENQQHVDIHEDEDEEEKFEQDWFYLGLGLGFAFGLLAPFLILLIKRSWSEAYFTVVDQIINWFSHKM